jgi:hypothetical protein
MYIRWIGFVFLTLAGCGHNPSAALTALDGTVHRPLELGDARAAVLVFVLHDCPISNAYAPEIGRIVDEYGRRGVAFYVVQSDVEVSEDELRRHAHEFGFRCPVLIGRDRALARQLGITRTPEVAVITAGRKLEYRGRIDDRYVDFGRQRKQPTVRDLREALDAILAGQAVANARTEAIGCTIN